MSLKSGILPPKAVELATMYTGRYELVSRGAGTIFSWGAKVLICL